MTARSKGTVAILISASVIGVAACAPAEDGPSVYDALPWVQAIEVDPKETFDELIEDSDLVVVGRIVDIHIEDIGVSSPAPDEAPEFRRQHQRIDLIVQPRGTRDRITVSFSRTFQAGVSDQFVQEVNIVSMPKGEVLFALMEASEEAKAEGWQYYCTSGDMGLCPLEVREGRWVSPREPERGAVFPLDDPNHPGSKNARAVVRDIAVNHGTQAMGVD